MDMRLTSCPLNLVIAGARITVTNVVPDVRAEKCWILGNQPDDGSQFRERQIFDIYAIDTDLSCLRVIKTLKQLEYGAFPRA